MHLEGGAQPLFHALFGVKTLSGLPEQPRARHAGRHVLGRLRAAAPLLPRDGERPSKPRSPDTLTIVRSLKAGYYAADGLIAKAVFQGRLQCGTTFVSTHFLA